MNALIEGHFQLLAFYPPPCPVLDNTRRKSALRARPRCARITSSIPHFLYQPPLVVQHIGPGLEGPQGQILLDHPIIR